MSRLLRSGSELGGVCASTIIYFSAWMKASDEFYRDDDQEADRPLMKLLKRMLI